MTLRAAPPCVALSPPPLQAKTLQEKLQEQMDALPKELDLMKESQA